MNCKSKSGLLEIPPAPLVRESLDKSNADFKQKKEKLLPELPFLTIEQLMEYAQYVLYLIRDS